MPHPQEIEDNAQRLYTVYCHAVGGKAYDGRPLPAWAEFSTDPGKQTQANGWRVLGELVANDPRVMKLQERATELEDELIPAREQLRVSAIINQRNLVKLGAAEGRIAELTALLDRVPHDEEWKGECFGHCVACAWERMKGGAK